MRTLRIARSTELSATTMVVARIMSTPPTASRTVSDWPSTATLSTTAENGSRAPKMAVGVEPISWIARVVHARDMTVGINARATSDHQPLLWVGSVRPKPRGIRQQ